MLQFGQGTKNKGGIGQEQVQECPDENALIPAQTISAGACLNDQKCLKNGQKKPQNSYEMALFNG
jgi:hypothetical protein